MDAYQSQGLVQWPKIAEYDATTHWEVKDGEQRAGRKVVRLSVFIHLKQCPLEAILAAMYHSGR